MAARGQKPGLLCRIRASKWRLCPAVSAMRFCLSAGSETEVLGAIKRWGGSLKESGEP